MVTCADHPDSESVGKCLRCGGYYCEICMSSSPAHIYCNACNKAITAKANNYRYGSITLLVLVGTLLSVGLGLVILVDNVRMLNFPALQLDATGVNTLSSYVKTPGAARAAFTFAAMTLYFILGIGIMANRRWALYFGFLLNAAVFYVAVSVPAWGFSENMGIKLAAIGILVVSLALSKKTLVI